MTLVAAIKKFETEFLYCARLLLLGIHAVVVLYLTSSVFDAALSSLYLTLFSIVMFATVADAGFSSALMHFLSKSDDFGNLKSLATGKNQVLNDSLRVLLLISLNLILMSGALLFFYNEISMDGSLGAYSWWIVAAFTAQLMQLQIKSVCEGLGFVELSTRAAVVATALAVSSSSWLLVQQKPVLAILAFFSSNASVYMFLTREIWFPVIANALVLGRFDTQFASRFARHALKIGFVWLCGYFGGYGMVLIAANIKPDEFVVEIGQLNMVLVQLSMFLSVFLIPKQNLIGGYWARTEKSKIRHLVTMVERLTVGLLFVVTTLFCILWVAGPGLVELFLRSDPLALAGVLAYLFFYVLTFIRGTALRFAEKEYLVLWMPVFALLNITVLFLSDSAATLFWSMTATTGVVQFLVTRSAFRSTFKV